MAPSARVLRFADYPITRWKNGLGLTRELAGVGARADGMFSWRLSMAEIAVDAPFSRYAGIERHLAVVAGGPLELVVSGVPSRIAIGGAIATFSGDAAVSARPLDGVVTDLNFMINPTEWRGSLETVPSITDFPATNVIAVVSIRDGLRIRVTDATGAKQKYTLHALDCLLLDEATPLTIESTSAGAATESVAVLIRLDRRAAP